MQTLNLTPPRKAVLQVIQVATDHPTATEIMDRLNQQGQRFAYASIYNSLRYLAEHGMIQELNLGNGVTRYDGRLEEHQHLICRRCGAVMESTAAVPLDFIAGIEKETGFRVEQSDVRFVGLCPTCWAELAAHRVRPG